MPAIKPSCVPAVLRSLDDAALGELASIFPALFELGAPARGRLAGERFRAHYAIRAVLERLASRQPVVVALDDVHWADPASIEVIAHHLACRYHGVTLDGAGTIVRVPAMPDCALEGRRPVESFPVAEANDAVFVYFASDGHREPAPLTLPEELTSADWTAILCVSPWACNYRYALDNLADPMHGSYLHANSFTLAFGAKQDTMRIEKNATGFVVARVEQQGENFDWTEMVTQTAAPYCRLDLPYPPAAGPGGGWRRGPRPTRSRPSGCWRGRRSGTPRAARSG